MFMKNVYERVCGIYTDNRFEIINQCGGVFAISVLISQYSNVVSSLAHKHLNILKKDYMVSCLS